MELRYTESAGVLAGIRVLVGDKPNTFRGEPVEVTAILPPTTPGSTGRVELRFLNDDSLGLFYPAVIDARWERSR